MTQTEPDKATTEVTHSASSSSNVQRLIYMLSGSFDGVQEPQRLCLTFFFLFFFYSFYLATSTI